MMKKLMYINICIFFASQFVLSSTIDGNINKNNYVRFNIGIGLTPKYFSDYPSIAYGIILTIENNSKAMVFRYLNSSELLVLYNSLPEPKSNINEFSVLYGKTFLLEKQLLRLSAYIGIGYVINIQRGEFIPTGYESYSYKKIVKHSIGIPFEFQVIYFKPNNPNFGIGIYSFANINKVKNYWGFLINIQGSW